MFSHHCVNNTHCLRFRQLLSLNEGHFVDESRSLTSFRTEPTRATGKYKRVKAYITRQDFHICTSTLQGKAIHSVYTSKHSLLADSSFPWSPVHLRRYIHWGELVVHASVYTIVDWPYPLSRDFHGPVQDDPLLLWWMVHLQALLHDPFPFSAASIVRLVVSTGPPSRYLKRTSPIVYAVQAYPYVVQDHKWYTNR